MLKWPRMVLVVYSPNYQHCQSPGCNLTSKCPCSACTPSKFLQNLRVIRKFYEGIRKSFHAALQITPNACMPCIMHDGLRVAVGQRQYQRSRQTGTTILLLVEKSLDQAFRNSSRRNARTPTCDHDSSCTPSAPATADAHPCYSSMI